MSQYMVDEARLREIVRLVVTIVLEEMERTGYSPARCVTIGSQEPVLAGSAPRAEGVSGSIIMSSKVLPPVPPAVPALVDWRSKTLVTEHDVKNLGRDVRIIIDKRTIVTPLAADTARDRGVVLKKE